MEHDRVGIGVEDDARQEPVRSESPSIEHGPVGGVGSTRREAQADGPSRRRATTKPAHGPAAPMSKSARRSGKRERMRMNAPNVPSEEERRRRQEVGQGRVDAVADGT